jgi:hypothetical protein
VPHKDSDSAPVLVLDVYDILNVCVERPNDMISEDERKISLPLDGLRAKLKSLVDLHRNPPRPVPSRSRTAAIRLYPALAPHDQGRLPKKQRKV